VRGAAGAHGRFAVTTPASIPSRVPKLHSNTLPQIQGGIGAILYNYGLTPLVLYQTSFRWTAAVIKFVRARAYLAIARVVEPV